MVSRSLLLLGVLGVLGGEAPTSTASEHAAGISFGREFKAVLGLALALATALAELRCLPENLLEGWIASSFRAVDKSVSNAEGEASKWSADSA